MTLMKTFLAVAATVVVVACAADRLGDAPAEARLAVTPGGQLSGLPAWHPPVASAGLVLPEGHPPVGRALPTLPEGHPPVPGWSEGGLPEGHPACPALSDGGPGGLSQGPVQRLPQELVEI